MIGNKDPVILEMNRNQSRKNCTDTNRKNENSTKLIGLHPSVSLSFEAVRFSYSSFLLHLSLLLTSFRAAKRSVVSRVYPVFSGYAYFALPSFPKTMIPPVLRPSPTMLPSMFLDFMRCPIAFILLYILYGFKRDHQLILLVIFLSPKER